MPFSKKVACFLPAHMEFISNKTTERQLGLDGEIAFDMYMVYKEGNACSAYSDILFFFRNELNKILLAIRN